MPPPPIIKRIAQHADGWFVMASPEEYPEVVSRIGAACEKIGRDPGEIGTEAGVVVVGAREAEWRDRVKNWHDTGLTHLCLRTLGGGLSVDQHIDKLRWAVADLPVENESIL